MNKKALTNLLSLVAIMVALCVCSCGKSSDKEDDEDKTEFSEKTVRKLLDKIDDGEMKESDWNEAIDQLEAAYDEVVAKGKDALKKSDNYDEFEDEMMSIMSSYDIVVELYEKLESSELDMKTETYERFKKVVEKGQEKFERLSDKERERFDSDYYGDSCTATIEEVAEAPAEEYYVPAEAPVVDSTPNAVASEYYY